MSLLISFVLWCLRFVLPADSSFWQDDDSASGEYDEMEVNIM